MTATIIRFVGRAEREARINLEALIAHAKEARLFVGEHAQDWSSNTWDLRKFFLKASSAPPGLVAHFTTLETTRRGVRSKDAIDFDDPFMDAAKALTTEYLRTTGDNSVSKIVATLRTIEKAFRDLGMAADIVDLTPTVLDRAQEIICERYSDAFSYGRLLERLVNDFISPACITTLRLTWATSILFKAPVRNDRVNEDGARGNTAKLPKLQSIFDLSSVFHESTYIPDQIVTSWFALAMFAPSRVEEIIGLPSDCETEMDGVYGLSWRPLKKGEPLTKFAPTPENAEVARIAIERLLALGEKSRVAHKWYEENPGQLYLPAGFEHLRGMPITLWEAAQIIGRTKPITNGQAVDRALQRCGSTRDLSRGHPDTNPAALYLKLVTFESLERYVIDNLPRTFPFIDPRSETRGSEALFCLPDEILRGAADTQQYIPRYLTYSQIKHELGSKPTGQTVFSRNSLIDPESGLPWRLNTHQPRHLLNTVAQSKHLSQELIAFWSGRKSVRQNSAYNHVPQEAYIEAFILLGESGEDDIKIVGPLSDKARERAHKEGISIKDVLRLELGSTITTRYGLCRHDYSLMPCPKDKDCINCGENTFIKGNEKHLQEARLQLGFSETAARKAEAQVEAGRYGAQRWATMHRQRAERWQLAIDQLTDNAIPDGTLITLPPPTKTQSKAGLSAAIRKVGSHDDIVHDQELDRTLDYLWSDQALN